MRLWTLHPGYLDAKGLVAAWREGLLAQKVLEGGTKGYASHPQLLRFKGCGDPLRSIAQYLEALRSEAESRGFSFDASRIRHFDPGYRMRIGVNSGQLRYELELLRWKLESRDPERRSRLETLEVIRLNAAFEEREGGIEDWERAVEALRLRAMAASRR
jgi:hypothetical protein